MGGRGATSSHGKTKAKAKPRQKGHLTADEIPKTPEETAKYNRLRASTRTDKKPQSHNGLAE